MHKEIRQIIHESIIFTLRFNNNTDLYVNLVIESHPHQPKQKSRRKYVKGMSIGSVR